MIPGFENRPFWIATVAYVLLCVVALAGADPSVHTLHAADGTSWLDPARGLHLHGAFVSPDDPDRVMNYRPPAYPIFVAGAMILAGEQFAQLVVAVQLVLVYAIAALTAHTARLIDARFAVGLFCLILFNPNLFGTAFFVQSEIVNAVFLAALLLCLIRFVYRPTLWLGAAAGCAAGLAGLTRPEGLFLIAATPFAFPALAALQARQGRWLPSLAASVLCISASLAVTAPWMSFNYINGDGYRLSAAGSTAYFVWGNATQLEMHAAGVSESVAERRMQAAQAALSARYGEDWEAMAPAERDDALVAEGLRKLTEYGAADVLMTAIKAKAQYLLAGGAGRLFALTGDPDAAPFAVMVREGHSDHLEAVWSALSKAGLANVAIWVAAVGYVVATRALGLIGIYRYLRRSEYGLLLVIFGGIAFYALVMPFYGLSRFRVSVEILFAILAWSGAIGLADLFRRYRA